MAARKNPLRTYTMTPELIAGLEELKRRDGIPVSTSVQRAVRVWLEAKGISVKVSE